MSIVGVLIEQMTGSVRLSFKCKDYIHSIFTVHATLTCSREFHTMLCSLNILLIFLLHVTLFLYSGCLC